MSSNSSRNVVVLGANRGLGLAFASRYLEAGDHVVATARDLDAAADLAALAARHQGRATLARADLADGASLEALAGIVPFERIDLLLVNAGVFGGEEDRIEAVQPGDVAETFLVNAVGPLRVAQVFWPRLDRGSKLVCLTSLMGSIADNGGGGRYGYRMSKAALNMLVRNLGHESEPKGVVVMAIHPGWVRTDMGGPNAPLSIDESVDAMVATIDAVGMERNGGFVDRNGEPLPW